MSKRYIPILALLLSVPFWFLAALNYPGGTSWDTTTHGFSLASNYVSSLFQPLALNGMLNTARFFAFIAMLLYTAGVSVMFWVISSSYPKSAASKTVQIFGVGSMVYTFIAVTTPMHNLLVVIAAIFLAVACAGMLVLLHQDSKHKLYYLASSICFYWQYFQQRLKAICSSGLVPLVSGYFFYAALCGSCSCTLAQQHLTL